MVLTLIIKELGYQKKKDLNKCLFATNGKKFKDIDLTSRKTGCAALDMAYVAAGRFDGYFQENLSLWDIAAGMILISEAGGNLNSIDLSKKEKIEILASSSSISEKMLEKLNKF